MELQIEELKKVIKTYRLENLNFVGYEWTTPDDCFYYFSDKNDALYILVASDYVSWGCGNDEPPKTIQTDYYKDHKRNFLVKKWLTTHDGLDEKDESGDFEGYIYWASNGDRCTMAEIDGKVSDYELRGIDKGIPYRSQTSIAIYAKRMIMSEKVSAIPRPSYQNEEHLKKNILDAIIVDIKDIARIYSETDIENFNIHYIQNLIRSFHQFATEWSKNTDDNHEVMRKIVEINNQGWLTLCAFRENRGKKNELKKLLKLLEEF